jgi:hypothetical protein
MPRDDMDGLLLFMARLSSFILTVILGVRE